MVTTPITRRNSPVCAARPSRASENPDHRWTETSGLLPPEPPGRPGLHHSQVTILFDPDTTVPCQLADWADSMVNGGELDIDDGEVRVGDDGKAAVFNWYTPQPRTPNAVNAMTGLLAAWAYECGFTLDAAWEQQQGWDAPEGTAP